MRKNFQEWLDKREINEATGDRAEKISYLSKLTGEDPARLSKMDDAELDALYKRPRSRAELVSALSRLGYYPGEIGHLNDADLADKIKKHGGIGGWLRDKVKQFSPDREQQAQDKEKEIQHATHEFSIALGLEGNPDVYQHLLNISKAMKLGMPLLVRGIDVEAVLDALWKPKKGRGKPKIPAIEAGKQQIKYPEDVVTVFTQVGNPAPVWDENEKNRNGRWAVDRAFHKLEDSITMAEENSQGIKGYAALLMRSDRRGAVDMLAAMDVPVDAPKASVEPAEHAFQVILANNRVKPTLKKILGAVLNNPSDPLDPSIASQLKRRENRKLIQLLYDKL